MGCHLLHVAVAPVGGDGRICVGNVVVSTVAVVVLIVVEHVGGIEGGSFYRLTEEVLGEISPAIAVVATVCRISEDRTCHSASTLISSIGRGNVRAYLTREDGWLGVRQGVVGCVGVHSADETAYEVVELLPCVACVPELRILQIDVGIG